MASTFSFIQGNRRPYFAIVVKNVLTNAAVDLTGASAVFYFRHRSGRTAKVSGSSVTLTDAAAGEIEYRWAAGDLDVPGFYQAEFRITHTDAKVQSVLIDDVEVKPKLG